MPKSFRLAAWDCLQILTKKFSDQQVRMVVECDGRLDESPLAEAATVFQLSAALFAESITMAVCFAGDDANEEVVNRFLDFHEIELPS